MVKLPFVLEFLLTSFFSRAVESQLIFFQLLKI
jgi:hypothetical protein